MSRTLLTSRLQGDGTFEAPATHSVGSGASSTTLADFNGDGVIDLATVNYNSAQVSVLLGKGDGSFQSPATYSVGVEPTSSTAGDFNGDGVPDLVTADHISNQVSVLLGNGDGTFQAPAAYSVGSQPLFVTVGDFNGDGVTDLVTADSGSNQISVLLGNSSEQTISAEKLLTITPIEQFSLTTRYEAHQADTTIEQAQEQIYTMRGIIGAFHTRLETALRVTSIRSENIATAESQIRDVDVADEASHLARNQILQQAGASVLSQANRSPALALTLLEGL